MTANLNDSVREPPRSAAGFHLAMKHQNHTSWSATAAIAAALALSATPLAAQSVTPAPDAPVAEPVAPPVAPPVAASPAPTIDVPDVSAAPVASEPAPEPAPEPAATVRTTTTRTTRTTVPAPLAATHTTVTRSVARTAPAAAAPVAAVPVAPPPANAIAPLPAEPVAAAPVPEPQPAPTQTADATGTLGAILLGLLALAILTVGLLFLRRRHPAAEAELEPVAARPVERPMLEPAVAATPMAAPTLLRRRDLSPVAGALPSAGAAVDLPRQLPDSYQERAALLERMVAARPDKANPFTDRGARTRRARLIMQSLGVTFDREPRIDLSQYPNNWPELARQYHKAA